MKRGFVFGKFMPLHQGHLALIDFATKHCDLLYVIICHTNKEPISGSIRQRWLTKALEKQKNTVLISFWYSEDELPNTSVTSMQASQLWSEAFSKLVGDVDVVFTSEDYGNYVAKFMGISHILFDKARALNPISSTNIRESPVVYWEWIAEEARPYFVKKIAILGTESTGKSTLAERLAAHYQTSFVPEVGRDIVEKTEECSFDDLCKIAELHAKEILVKTSHANRVLFIDTDLNITKSYSSFLFKRRLIVPRWIEEVNRSDLYLFLETDCPYIQDGTRIDEEQRNSLSLSHKKILAENGISHITIGGSWEQRFVTACKIVDAQIMSKKGMAL
jgi:HTH-type transcriptional regulator, transcriptional repressor of NAD biosynthesis genes